MKQYLTTVTRKGQVTIPGPLRKALGISPKDKIAFQLVGEDVRLQAVKSRLLAGFGAVKPKKVAQDFRQVRREVEEEVGVEAARES